ncbi:MAG: arsenite methyltransferase [Anaerolineae bacterium]|nr:arsenite methyltransferase [Anaerolineae bacterium]
MEHTNNTIHEAVREHYGAIAQKAGASQSTCCGPAQDTASCSCSQELYDAQLLENLPTDVTGLSLGCGDPVTIANLQPGETVLDLGSGGGIDCFLAWHQVGSDGYVIGIDMTPDMLAEANANKEKLGAENVEFRRGQIEEMPVESNSIDIVMSNCVINLSPDKAAVFREAFRVLKPGGRVSISDIVTEGDFSPEMREQLDQWAECVTGAIAADQYAALMRKAGFVDIQIVDKVDAEGIVERQKGMPRVFSARITAGKPG